LPAFEESSGNPRADPNSAQSTSPSLLCSPTTTTLIEFTAPKSSARAPKELALTSELTTNTIAIAVLIDMDSGFSATAAYALE
jgi:hypothetical protein